MPDPTLNPDGSTGWDGGMTPEDAYSLRPLGEYVSGQTAQAYFGDGQFQFGVRIDPQTEERMTTESNELRVKLVDDRDGRVNVIAEGLTYGEGVAVLQAIQDAGGNPMLYDLVSERTGRFVSWVLR
jgi:hypothetical protein